LDSVNYDVRMPHRAAASDTASAAKTSITAGRVIVFFKSATNDQMTTTIRTRRNCAAAEILAWMPQHQSQNRAIGGGFKGAISCNRRRMAGQTALLLLLQNRHAPSY
jgi:hypothetical protein